MMHCRNLWYSHLSTLHYMMSGRRIGISQCLFPPKRERLSAKEAASAASSLPSFLLQDRANIHLSSPKNKSYF
jgi:hypothetical protein